MIHSATSKSLFGLHPLKRGVLGLNIGILRITIRAMLFQFRVNLLQGPTNNLIGSAGKRRSYAAARELPSVSEVECARLSSSSPEGERIDPEGASSESPVPHQPSGTHVQRIEVSDLSA